MANYIGNVPSAGEFKHLDSIASQFNGSSVTFALKFNAVTQSIGDATQLIVSLNGVIQEPLVAYTLGTGGSTIIFASAPANGDTCFIVMLGGVGNTTTPSDNSVTTAKIVAGAVTSSKISIDGDISFPDDDKLILGTGSDLQIYHSSSDNASYITESGAGNFYIKGDNLSLQSTTGEQYAIFRKDGNVVLYHDNSPKIETTSTGIDVTGETYTTSLTVNGSTANRGLSITTATDDVTDNEVIFNAPSAGSGELIFQTVSQERVRIDRSGNVGIGTDSPTTALTVSTDGTEQLTINRADASININNTVGTILFTGDDPSANQVGARIQILASQNWSTNAYGSHITFSNDDGGTLTERVRIDNSGNVGIGTTNPSVKLHIQEGSSGGSLTEAFRISDNSYTNVAMYSGGADGEIKIGAAGQLRGSYKAQYAGTGGSYNFNIGTNNTNAITIDTSQNVSIGAGSSPSERLQIGGNFRAGNTGATTSFDGGGNDRYIGVSSLNGGDAMFIAHASGYGVAYFGYEPTDDKLIIACDNGGGNNKIDFSVNAGTNANGATDNLSGITPAMTINANSTINTYSTVVGGYHYYTNSGTIDTDYVANSGYVFEVAGKVNPNSGGSTYVDPFFGHIYIGHGWNGSSLTAYIYYVALQPAARDVFPSGSGFSGDALEVCFVSSGTEYTTVPVSGAGSYNIRVKALNYNSTYGSQFELHITRKA